MTFNAERLQVIRNASEALCEPLQVDDFGLQAAAFVSPVKWHLAHTTWFFETFVLKPYLPGYQPFHPLFEILFNSYYNGVGEQYPRPQRSLLSRPTIREVFHYRQAVNQALEQLLQNSPCDEALVRIELGLQHEQQHQELMLTDLKYCFYQNPLHPTYKTAPELLSAQAATPMGWRPLPEGRVEIGAVTGFCFDNESPRHSVWLNEAALADRPVTNAEYLAFVEAGGYRRPELWLADGWACVQSEGWQAPLYWQHSQQGWQVFTLHGDQPLAPGAPVCHVSYYEADAFARWREARLPTEVEWETAAGSSSPDPAHFVESGFLQPRAATSEHWLGGLWQWTASAYAPYPGFRPARGTVGEYNGKFMCNQMVLRGGSCVTPFDHIRASYRNFFYPADRWQFSGIRLARANS